MIRENKKVEGFEDGGHGGHFRRKQFLKFWILCCPDAFHQESAQCGPGGRCIEYRNGTISASIYKILNLRVTQCLSKFQFNPICVAGGDVV